MLSGVEAQNVLALARAGIDGADMPASLHFPNRCHHAFLFYGMIGNIFNGRCWR